MLRRLRYQLVDLVLRFPMEKFRRLKATEVASMIKDEVESFGEFIGDAFALPVFLGGQAIIAFTFIALQNVWLGLLTIFTISIQVVILPRLRRRVLELGRERQISARQLSGRISEIVDGISSIHVNDTSNYEKSEITNRLGRIFSIRYELYQRKFLVKFVSNFFAQFTPFLFYAVGGYFAIRGDLDVGQLVATIAAYKELPSPINGLILWDQKRADVKIKYALIIENFESESAIEETLQRPHFDNIPALRGEIQCIDLGVTDEIGTTVIDRINVALKIDEMTAVVGRPNSGSNTFAKVIARLEKPTHGRCYLNSEPLSAIPFAVTGRRIGYVDSSSFLPEGTLGDTLLYGLKWVPLGDLKNVSTDHKLRQINAIEARRAGNSELEFERDWVDYSAAGVKGPDGILQRVFEVLEAVQLDEFVFDVALSITIDQTEYPELCEQLILARNEIGKKLQNEDFSGFVDRFEPGKYNSQANIYENIVFGTFNKIGNGRDFVANNDYLHSVLSKTKLDVILFDIGIELAQTAIELYSELPLDSPFYDQLDFMTADEVAEFPEILNRNEKGAFRNVSDSDVQKVMSVALRYVESHSRLGLLSKQHEAQIIEARRWFRDEMSPSMRNEYSFHEPTKYNDDLSIQDNILNGRINQRIAGAADRVQTEIRKVLIDAGLRDALLEIGLSFNIGTAGKRLSDVQKQKAVLARALLKRADLLILNQAFNASDLPEQLALIERILKLAQGRNGDARFGVIWVLSNAALASKFDRVLVFERGSIVEDGDPKALALADGEYAALLT